MAKKTNYNDQRKKAATALRALGGILFRNGICTDIGPLSSAAAQCSTPSVYGDNSWGYDISNLVFRLKTPKGTIPSAVKEFRVELSISMAVGLDREAVDQFINLEINLEKYAYNETGAELKAAWHLERHIIDTEKDSPHLTEDIHPLYHFQFGGARMSKRAHNLGETFLLDPPRIMHPPMDGILAVDFLLANYAGTTWKTLREDAQYSNLISPQFERIWKPYFDAVAGSWAKPRAANSDFLCPFV